MLLNLFQASIAFHVETSQWLVSRFLYEMEHWTETGKRSLYLYFMVLSRLLGKFFFLKKNMFKEFCETVWQLFCQYVSGRLLWKLFYSWLLLKPLPFLISSSSVLFTLILTLCKPGKQKQATTKKIEKPRVNIFWKTWLVTPIRYVLNLLDIFFET